jgi:hypothetical protein
MEHSIAARFAVRPAARFVRPSVRSRERQLGLRAAATFHAAPARATVLRRADLGPLVSLKASWRAVTAQRAARPSSGRPRHGVAMHWARSGRPGAGRRSSAAPAPWRA